MIIGDSQPKHLIESTCADLELVEVGGFPLRFFQWKIRLPFNLASRNNGPDKQFNHHSPSKKRLYMK